jgi:hypothetical protein
MESPGFSRLDSRLAPAGNSADVTYLGAYTSGRPLAGVPQPLFTLSLDSYHWQNNVVAVLLKLEHKLDSTKLVRHAKINCGGGTEEIHRSRTFPSPGIYIFEVKSGFFLLKKYSHTLRHTLRSLRFAPANCRRMNIPVLIQEQAGLQG